MSNSIDILWLPPVAVAVAAALLVWVIGELGSSALQRYRRLYTERASVRLRDLYLFVDPEQLLLLHLSLTLLVALLAWALVGSWVVVLVLFGLAAALPWWLFRLLRQRRLDRLEQQLPDALLLLSGALKAGVGLSQAMVQLVKESQAPLSQEIDLVLREQRLGVGLDAALDNLGQRLPLQSVILVVSAMRIAAETGGQLAETLERTSQTLRQKLAMEGKIRSLTAQGKLQAWVVGALPLAMMWVLLRMEPEAMGLIFTTRSGWGALMVVVLLEFFGVLLIRKIVAIDV